MLNERIKIAPTFDVLIRIFSSFNLDNLTVDFFIEEGFKTGERRRDSCFIRIQTKVDF